MNFVTETSGIPSEWAVDLSKDCRDGNLSPSARSNGSVIQEFACATQALPITSESASVHEHDGQYQYGMSDVHLPPVTPASPAVLHPLVYSDPEESAASSQEHRFLESSTPERCNIELTTREAFLVRSYTRKVAPWVSFLWLE